MISTPFDWSTISNDTSQYGVVFFNNDGKTALGIGALMLLAGVARLFFAKRWLFVVGLLASLSLFALVAYDAGRYQATEIIISGLGNGASSGIGPALWLAGIAALLGIAATIVLLAVRQPELVATESPQVFAEYV
jgi:hypothetical protein